MNQLRVRLFGKLTIHFDDRQVSGCDSLKVKELLSYLLLNRDRPHARETLASLLWGDTCTTQQSRKYLRNVLWRLNTAVDECAELEKSRLLEINNRWIQLRSIRALWLDVDVFERAYDKFIGISERELTPDHARVLRDAVSVYTAPLLVAWHQDWCALERNRLRHMNLVMLEKVSGYHEARAEYEISLSFAERILRCDRAHEAAHVRIMRLFNEMGDRTSALRQFRRCQEALNDELDAAPAPATAKLFEEIRTGHPSALAS